MVRYRDEQLQQQQQQQGARLRDSDVTVLTR